MLTRRFFIGIVFMFLMFVFVVGTGRYKKCSEGCCRHELCAYDKICYPRSKCRYGCPDGDCVGTEGNTMCIPYKPCTSVYDCGLGNVCTMHYNLGYNVCQYNLDIGSTLCYDRRKRGRHQVDNLLD
ncbi:hypothetical protein LSH36_10g14053 [Paralvinella palmiformis]|uniref:Uncharacterized protein n=1 Tax=Paralvinella palmiformis TaxID=53620 RepID=A0AAD9NJH3_9ANNE|nr:hypothetical protein LSH36_10g14053 [Paralvinella palmiformis]